MGGSEIAFMHKGKRSILTVTYKGEGGGSILFHQTSWDPVFLQDFDPEAPIDLLGKLQSQASQCPHSLTNFEGRFTTFLNSSHTSFSTN